MPLRRLLCALLPLSALIACEMVPANVEGSDIDDAVAFERWKTVCKGLEMKDDSVRRYAAQRLEEVADPIAQECVCEHAKDERTGRWDLAILDGLKTTSRDDMLGCFMPGLEPPDSEQTLELVVAMSSAQAPSLSPTFRGIMNDTSRSVEVRTRIVQYFSGTGDAAIIAELRALLSDSDVGLRAAAAEALGGQKGDSEIQALLKAANEDEEGAVRAAALLALKKSGLPEADEMACTAMMEDPSPEVRKTAILSYRGTKRVETIPCLKERAMTLEEEGSVREALLTVLKSSPKQEAADVLCDAMPFFIKSYVGELHPDRDTGTNIIKAQNDRDWERSYECVQRAYGQRGGYSCMGKKYVGSWFQELGNPSAFVPKCPGDEE